MHTPNLSLRLQLQRYLPLQSSLSARHSFLGKPTLRTAKPNAAFSLVLGEVSQRPSQRIRAWRERMTGNRLAQAVYGKCSLVLAQ